MAKSAIPDPLTRRHLIEREQGEAQALKIAESYLADGRSVEAIEFLRQAGASEGLQQIREEALASGDVFLLRAVAVAMGDAPSREEWQTLGEAAASAGKDQYAAEARRYAERGEG